MYIQTIHRPKYQNGNAPEIKLKMGVLNHNDIHKPYMYNQNMLLT